MKKEITQCPYCKSKSGFQTEQVCRGTFVSWLYFNGKEESSGYGDSMQYGKVRSIYCIDCKKSLRRWIKK